MKDNNRLFVSMLMCLLYLMCVCAFTVFLISRMLANGFSGVTGSNQTAEPAVCEPAQTAGLTKPAV